MKTKEVLLVVGGIALGYLASTKKWGRNTATAVGNVATGVVDTATGVVTDVKDITLDTTKKIACEKKWQDEIGSVSRLSGEALQKSKSDYAKICMAS
jgi:hypothetical protein